MVRNVVIFVVLGLISLVAAGPATVRSRKDIENFIQFLEETKTGNANAEEFQARKQKFPFANDEELSGRFQGDIELDDDEYEVLLQQYLQGRNGFRTNFIGPWPDNTLVFEFADGEFDDAQKSAIWDAVRDIEAHTCVKFRYRTPSDTIYVNMTGEPTGCYAHIGHRRIRGAHRLNLARNTVGVGCFRHATIVHEIMHSLGFVHMHTTHNRDEYVKIEEQNIESGKEHNFRLYEVSEVNNFGIDYDYVSCLHYSANAFSANREPTIVALQNASDMGQRRFVTDSDWLRINRYYNCPGAWD
ncbi:hypothetical protein PYW07_014821 [Mythimna separata]|uniref:Metalloendopeptidase n=1 Tax=Mythimna separata TaxID=271217 RepID=A0AAD7Z2M5_MYTSE|nr:hypothetical protein PYW07_014821 [Mythimna separata]